jgi:hypothetical protein
MTAASSELERPATSLTINDAVTLELPLDVGLGEGETVGLGLSMGLGEGFGLSVGLGDGLGLSVGLGEGFGVSEGLGVGLGLSVGLADGLSVGLEVGLAFVADAGYRGRAKNIPMRTMMARPFRATGRADTANEAAGFGMRSFTAGA